jgi:hypothetical protein
LQATLEELQLILDCSASPIMCSSLLLLRAMLVFTFIDCAPSLVTIIKFSLISGMVVVLIGNQNLSSSFVKKRATVDKGGKQEGEKATSIC